MLAPEDPLRGLEGLLEGGRDFDQLRDVPAARKFPVAFEDLTGAAGKSHWRRLLAFVGARDLAASLETSLVRLGNATARRFANEEAVAAALRGAGC